MTLRLRAAAGLAGALLTLSACGGSTAEGEQGEGTAGTGDGGAPAASGTVTCAWGEGSSANPYLTEVAAPDDVVPASGTTDLRVATNLGDLTLTLDRAAMPYAAASLVHLAEQGFFDDTPCHHPRGTVAMANSGQGSDGSQFFLVWGDSQLPPAYTIVGAVDEAGLAVLDEVAANGNDGSLDPSPGLGLSPG